MARANGLCRFLFAFRFTKAECLLLADDQPLIAVVVG